MDSEAKPQQIAYRPKLLGMPSQPPGSEAKPQQIAYRPKLLGMPSQPPGIVLLVFSPPQAQQ
jgi:hypothetical protein